MQPTKADVLAQLRAAFPAEPIRAERFPRGDPDGDAYRDFVDGKTWEELDRSYVLPRCTVLSFLDAPQLVAVLPVYLRSLVEDGTRTSVPDTMLLVLNRKQARFDELAGVLSAAQRAAVVVVLESFAASESESGQPAEAARAAIEHWKTYLSTHS